MSTLSSGGRAAARVAGEVWRGARSPDPWRVHGLNGEPAVRRRLSWLADRLLELPDLPAPFRREFSPVEWHRTPATTIVNIVSAALDRVDDLKPSWARALARIVVVQHLAARAGWWPEGPEEIDDAEVARLLYVDTTPPNDSLVEALQLARARHVLGDVNSAVRLWLTADRLHRTPMPLLHVAGLLCRVGRFQEALWALRVALLEPGDHFPAPAVYGRARLLAAELALALATHTETTRGSMLDARRSSAELEAQNLTIAPSSPPAHSPPTRPLPQLAELVFFENETAPLASGGRFEAALAVATSTFVSPVRPDVPEPIPSAPISPSEPFSVPDLVAEAASPTEVSPTDTAATTRGRFSSALLR